MKLKTIEKDGVTYAVCRDGKPVYVHDDGKEVEFDADHAVGKIKAISDERDSLRTKAADFEAKLRTWDGLDAEKARQGLAALKNLDDKNLVDDLVKERLGEATKAWDTERTKLAEERDAERAKTHRLIVGSRFASSKYLGEQTVLPPSAAEALFGNHFRVDGDKAVAYDGDKPMYSRAKPGEVADFDEAVQQLVERHPDRDRLLKGSGSSGSGASGSTKSGKDDLFNLPPEERLARALGGAAN